MLVGQVLDVVKPLLTKDEMIILQERLQGQKKRNTSYAEEYKDRMLHLSLKLTSTY